MYQKRTYRDIIHNNRFTYFQVAVKETDLYIGANKDLSKEAREAVLKYRHQIEEYIRRVPEFQKSLIPLPLDTFAPRIINAMMEASSLTGTGPMAAVAGGISEFIGKELLKQSEEIIVENGGDIFLKTSSKTSIGIYAGMSPLSNRIGIKINPDDTPLGVCTSSGTVGHSISFGRADAVTVVSKSALLADAAATAIGNLVKDKGDFNRALEFAGKIGGIMGVLIIRGKEMAVCGKVELIEI
ncbi:MAG: UPF0280 family protein [Desulfobacterales bacterium]|nr:UPF0280 family protein [Desulfobacterales bacterium]